jgi:hypothetical protein
LDTDNFLELRVLGKLGIKALEFGMLLLSRSFLFLFQFRDCSQGFDEKATLGSITLCNKPCNFLFTDVTI